MFQSLDTRTIMTGRSYDTLLSMLLAGCLCACSASDVPGRDSNATETMAEIPSAAQPLVADLSADALIPPAEPTLTITAEPATLIFEWQPIESQTSAMLYRQDTLSGEQTLVHASDDARAESHRIASDSVTRAWQQQRYRIELCTTDDCVSSQWHAIDTLQAATAVYLQPDEHLAGERVAEAMAFNGAANLLALSMPLEGTLQMYQRIDNTWYTAQRSTLQDLQTSTTRRMTPEFSSSGDTLAILLEDSSRAGVEIRLLERLGEAWMQTDRITADAGAGRPRLSLSDDGNAMLLHGNDAILTWQRIASGWSQATTVISADAGGLGILASATDALQLRLFVLFGDDTGLQLRVMSRESIEQDWRAVGSMAVAGFLPGQDFHMHSDATGERLMIAGWESGTVDERIPTARLYDLASTRQYPTELILDTYGHTQLQAASTSDGSARLLFQAADTLSTVLLGWQADIAGDTAEFSLHARDASSDTWHRSLALPEDLPLDGSLMRDTAVLSADGSTMAVGFDRAASTTTDDTVTDVIVLY